MPLALARFDAPFDHPDFIFKPKLDGFRAVAYVEGGACRLVSRNRNAFKTFEGLAQAIAQDLSGRSAILDGEIVRPGADGRPLFYELMRRRGPFSFYAFDASEEQQMIHKDLSPVCRETLNLLAVGNEGPYRSEAICRIHSQRCGCNKSNRSVLGAYHEGPLYANCFWCQNVHR
jgi:hypothetical protein